MKNKLNQINFFMNQLIFIFKKVYHQNVNKESSTKSSLKKLILTSYTTEAVYDNFYSLSYESKYQTTFRITKHRQYDSKDYFLKLD